MRRPATLLVLLTVSLFNVGLDVPRIPTAGADAEAEAAGESKCSGRSLLGRRCTSSDTR
jgi:hypothetical protein